MTEAALIEAVPLPCLLVDRSERITAANLAARTMLGQGIVGRNVAAFLRQPDVLEAVEMCLSEETSLSARYLGNDGAQDTTYNVHCRFVPGIGWQNQGGALVSFEDLTHLQNADQMRRDFVANVSHELRTPLTALLGFIETLRGPAKDDAAVRERFLGIMEREAGRMNRLVDDLLSLSRVQDSERVRPTKALVLNDLLTSSLDSIRPVGQDANVDIDLNLPDQPIEVNGDDDQLRQVVSNLVENAIKYGAKGGVVRIDLTFEDYDKAMRGPSARISVRDFGPGIDPHHLARLTERFYRVDSHRSRELGGTGLGLAIVKHILNRHRGRLHIASEIGEGSVFTVILPAPPRSITS